MWRWQERSSMPWLAVGVASLVLFSLMTIGSCEEGEEPPAITEIPVPTEVIFRKGEGCPALASYTALSSFLANDFSTYMIDRITLHGVEKPFLEFRYGIPGAENYKQSAIVLHHTKYNTVDSIKELLHAYNVKPHPDLVRMDKLHRERQREMNQLNKAARALQKEISIIERDYLIDYDQTDALIDELYAQGLLPYDHNNDSPFLQVIEHETDEVDAEFAIATDEVVHAAEEMNPEAKQLITDLLIKQSEHKLAANAIRKEILPWLDSLREPLAVNRLRGVRYKFRLMEKYEERARKAAAAAAAAASDAVDVADGIGADGSQPEGEVEHLD